MTVDDWTAVQALLLIRPGERTRNPVSPDSRDWLSNSQEEISHTTSRWMLSHSPVERSSTFPPTLSSWKRVKLKRTYNFGKDDQVSEAMQTCI